MGKKIVLGVTGSIAAHKAVDIASLLTKEGHSVHAVLTADAQQFITALPFKTLSRNPVVTNLYDEEQGWKDLEHHHISDKDVVIGIASSGRTPSPCASCSVCAATHREPRPATGAWTGRAPSGAAATSM